jgi:hypothetical protein
MASADASAGSTRMAGTHLFQMVAHPELSKLGQVAIRDFLKMRARYLLLVKENNKAEGVNITPTTVVASLDPDLLENLACMGKIKDAECAEDCTDENIMSYLKSTQCKDAALTAEDIKNEVRSKVVFHMSEKDPALRVTKAVRDYMTLHRNLKLNLVKGKPKKAVEHIVSAIKPVLLKVLVESDLELDQSDLKKDFFQFIKYLEDISVVHDRHGRAAGKNGGGGSNMDDKIIAKGSGRGLGGKPGGSGGGGNKVITVETVGVIKEVGYSQGGTVSKIVEKTTPACLNAKSALAKSITCRTAPTQPKLRRWNL